MAARHGDGDGITVGWFSETRAAGAAAVTVVLLGVAVAPAAARGSTDAPTSRPTSTSTAPLTSTAPTTTPSTAATTSTTAPTTTAPTTTTAAAPTTTTAVPTTPAPTTSAPPAPSTTAPSTTALTPPSGTLVPGAPGWNGPVVQLNDNGAWCWYQDQRAIFTSDDRLLVGSTPGIAAPGGSTRPGTVELATLDLRTGARTREVMQTGFTIDDHNAPAMIELPGGRVVAAWADHSREPYVHVSLQEPLDLAWRAPTAVVAATGGAFAAYSNLLRLGAENAGNGRLYDLYRGNDSSPSALTSDDGGRTWIRAGTVLRHESNNGHVPRPYLRYAGNGIDRIDFVASSGNPREENGTSVSGGYLQGGHVFDSAGADLGPLGGNVKWSQLTPIRAGVPASNPSHTDTDVWTADTEIGPSGPVAVLTTRLPTAPATGAGRYDHRYEYARWTGTAWSVHELAFGGGELYNAEPDYTGNVTLDPSDVNRVVVSTNVNPVTGAALRSTADGKVHWELFEGTTADQGATWTWRAVTSNSSADNLRPTIVTAAGGRWALLWMRGHYTSYFDYGTSIVGIVHATASSLPRRPADRVGGPTTVTGGHFLGGTTGTFFSMVPGTGDGFLIAARPRWRFAARPLSGTFRSYAADTDGDGRDELLLVPAGGGTSYKLRLHDDGSVSTTSFQAPAATPLIADVNGDGRDDIIWFTPGPGGDSIWRMGPGGVPQSSPINVAGTYRPVATDIDGDGRTDIIWYTPGGGADPVWRFRADGGWDSLYVSIGGDYQPVAADFEGDRRGDVVWQARGGGDSLIWSFGPGAPTAHRTTQRKLPDTPLAVVDRNGDGRDDLFFNAPGDADDTWWYSGLPTDAKPR
ncbi:MAG: hypothetical protein JWM05_3758 [Acidimicrobiales bacterium]|nr:hypothetical protein [Acidimicrobiales bacterium]